MEKYLNEILYAYFKPQRNEKGFLKVLLNGSIIGFGQKVKIISNLTNLEPNIIGGLGKIMSIRNGVAHNMLFNEASSLLEIDFSLPARLNVMNSAGQLKKKILDKEIEAFYKELDLVVPRLIQKISDLNQGI